MFFLISSWEHLLLCPLEMSIEASNEYSKTCLKQPLSKRPKIGFQDQLSLRVDAGQK